MFKLNSIDIKKDLLEACKKKGFQPGSLLIAKEYVHLEMIFGDLEMELEKQTTTGCSASQLVLVEEGSVILFVDGHGIRRGKNGPWDFWYEILYREQSAYIHHYAFGSHKLKSFEIRTAN